VADQPGGRQAVQPLAQFGGRGHQQRLDGVDRLGTGLDRGLAGDPQRPGHLHRAVLGLGDAGRLARLHRPSGGVGVNGVALAAPPAGCPVGPVDLQNPLARGGQEPDEPGAVAARALHPPGLDLTQPTGPGQQLAIASPAGRGDGDAKPAAQLVPGGGHMDVLVGVDPNGDPCRFEVCHGGPAILPAATGGRTGRAGGQHCDESGSDRLLSGHAPPVGAARSGRGVEPTGLEPGTRPMGPRVRPAPRPREGQARWPRQADRSKARHPASRVPGQIPPRPPPGSSQRNQDAV
jgi:hypothetical protein